MLDNWEKYQKAVVSLPEMVEYISEIRQKIELHDKTLSEFDLIIDRNADEMRIDMKSISDRIDYLEKQLSALLASINVSEPLGKVDDGAQTDSVVTIDKPVAGEPETYPKLFTCDTLTSANPFGFIIEKIKDTYLYGIFVIHQLTLYDAELRINEDQSAQQRAIGALNSLVAPACEDFTYVQSPQRIINVPHGAGQLRKENDIWVIVRKMKIELK